MATHPEASIYGLMLHLCVRQVTEVINMAYTLRRLSDIKGKLKVEGCGSKTMLRITFCI